MAARLRALSVDAHDPLLLSRFWSGVLGWSLTEDVRAGLELLPDDDTGFRLRFVSSAEPKTSQNPMHFDLTSTSVEDQQATVARALSLGGRYLDVGQGPDAEHVVLADPEGNEFCVIEPANNFLAECGFVGALACDGTQAVGYFWSRALGWPLVWDQDQETAIRSPLGGPKITWGGPPVAPHTGRPRLRFDLAVGDGDSGGLAAEVDRLVALGAARLGGDRGDGGEVSMTDPDGNEFCVRVS